MCITPITLPDGTQVACRHCDLCRRNRLRDWLGRCVAEEYCSDLTVSVTLTYAGDGPETALLRYRDVQLMLKRMRKDGLSVRYLVAGEYGEQKGRAHWHCIFFFRGKVPEITMESRVQWKYWPHGFAYFQQPDYKGLSYVLKYILKDQYVAGQRRVFSMSKKPPIGYDYFMGLADRMAEGGFMMHAPEYRFADKTDHTGKSIRYWLQGAMRRLFIERFVETWIRVHGEEPVWHTDWLWENWFRKNEVADWESYDALPKPLVAAAGQQEQHPLTFLFLPAPSDAIAFLYPSGLVVVLKGQVKCLLSVNATDAAVGEELSRIGLQPCLQPLVCQWRVARLNELRDL